MKDHVPQVCARYHKAVELLGRRWTGAIIHVLLQGRTRYATFREAIPNITDRMLSERLRELEAEDLVVRHVSTDIPVRVEYELTPRGRELELPVAAIGKWAEKWLPTPKSGGKRSA